MNFREEHKEFVEKFTEEKREFSWILTVLIAGVTVLIIEWTGLADWIIEQFS